MANRQRATIAVLPASTRRSMSESDLPGIADLLKSVVDSTTSNEEVLHSLQLSSINWMTPDQTTTVTQQIMDPVTFDPAPTSRQSALGFWLLNIRFSVQDEEGALTAEEMDATNFNLPPPTTPTAKFRGSKCPTAEELLSSISPESAALLREILSGSAFSFDSAATGRDLYRRKRSCSCHVLDYGVNVKDGGDCGSENRKKSVGGGIVAWQNILHWAECDLADDNEEDDANGDGCGLRVSDLGVGGQRRSSSLTVQGQGRESDPEEEWFSSQDPAGKIYYYEENSNKSSWFLPVPGIALNEDHQNPSSPLSKSTTLESMEPRESTPPKLMPDVLNLVKKRHSTGDVADRFLKARSLVILDPSRKSSEAANVKNSSLPRSPNARSIWSSSSGIDSELVVIKESSLSRTKITENAKKLRKNWSTVYVVLTEEHLSLFKDQKSFTNSSSRKPEIEIPLYGSSVERVTEKSSRKNVFQLNAERGTLQILFQTDELKLAEEWIETLEEVIGEQEQVKTEDNYSLRLCSTSPDTFLDHPIGEKKNARLGRAKSTKVKITGSVENLSMEEKHKIKAQLKKFFNRRPPRESLVKKGIYKDESVFGCHLDKLCARESQSVPRFVQECIAVIESKPENLKTDGIYRASGNLSQVQKIRLQVDQNNLTCLVQEEDVHVLAGSLKLFFREMKEPLIPTNMFQRALEASSLPSRKDKLNSFRDLVSRLDKPNKSTLCLLLKHLLKVSEFADFNRMLIPNLAIVFGPTLMWPAQESTNMALDLMQQNLVVEALLLDFNSIFER